MVVFSAYLVGRQVLEWLPVYISTCLGGTLGFSCMFALGARLGREWLVHSRWKLASEERLQRAESWLERYGGWLILANRFLSGIRSVIALSAGIGGMPWKKVMLLSLASMALWNGVLMYAGVTVGSNWGAVSHALATYHRGVIALMLTGALIIIVRWRRKRRVRVDSS